MSQVLRHRSSIAFLALIFINASVDLGHKITLQNTVFKLYEGDERIILTALLNALIILPYILFFSLAGKATDRVRRRQLLIVASWVVLAFTMLIGVFFAMGYFWLAYGMTLLLGAQSAFFGPAKLAYLREFYPQSLLASANGLAQSTVIVAILLASLGFSLVFEWRFVESLLTSDDIVRQMLPIGLMLIALAILQVLLAINLPEADANTDTQVKDKALNAQPESDLFGFTSILKPVFAVVADPLLRAAVVGLTMFWSSGQVLLAIFPDHYSTITGERNTAVIQAIMACLALGTGIGAVVAGRLAGAGTGLKLLPLASSGLIGAILMIKVASGPLVAVVAFLLAGLMGGLFLIPLYTFIQLYVHSKFLGRALAVNNLIQNCFMLAFLTATVFAALHQINAGSMLTGVLAYTIACAIYCCRALREADSAIQQPDKWPHV